MPDERLSGFDKFILAASLLGAAILGAALYRDDLLVKHFANTVSNAKAIGTIVSSKNDVRRRLRQSLSWYSARGEDTLFERDSLFTGEDSEVEIRIGSNVGLSLGANSLVVLQTLGNEMVLDLRMGTLVSKSSAKPIRVVHEGKVTEVQASSGVSFQRAKAGPLKIISRLGDVQVKVGGQVTSLKKDESLKIEKDRAPEKMAEPEAETVGPVITEIPAAEAADVAAAPEPEAAPAWTGADIEPQMHGPERPPEAVEVAKVATAPVPKPMNETHVLQLKAGADARQIASLPEAILNPPKFSWTGAAEGAAYTVEISEDKEFLSPLVLPAESLAAPGGAPQSLASAAAHAIWKNAQPGDYYWRVRGQNSQGSEALLSPVSKIRVRVAPPAVQAPKIEPETVKDVSLLKAGKKVELKWAAVPFAEGYRVVASETSKIVKGEKWEISLPPNKETTVRVAAVDSKGRLISDEAVQKLKLGRKLDLATPQLKMPADNTTVVSFGGNQLDPLLFSWAAVPGAVTYELQFAEDEGFKKIVGQEKVKSNQFVLKKKLSDQLVYWRVRSRAEEHTSPWSAARRYDLQTD